jgi:hypothetical protein
MMQFLPAPVINQLVNFASFVPAPVAATALLEALQAYEYTVAINLATAAGASAAAVAASGYIGYQGGSAINQAIENAYGQNAGGALYDLLHGQAEAELFRNQTRNSAPVCRPNWRLQ